MSPVELATRRILAGFSSSDALGAAGPSWTNSTLSPWTTGDLQKGLSATVGFSAVVGVWAGRLDWARDSAAAAARAHAATRTRCLR